MYVFKKLKFGKVDFINLFELKNEKVKNRLINVCKKSLSQNIDFWLLLTNNTQRDQKPNRQINLMFN